MLLLAVRKLTKSLDNLNEDINKYFKETTKKLQPLLKALATAKPFIDVLNIIFDFVKNRRGNNGRTENNK